LHRTSLRLACAAALFASLLLVGLAATPAAKAAVTASTITTPTDHTFITIDQDAATQTFAVSGTTSGGNPATDKVDINCYQGTSTTFVVANVPLNPDGSFSVPAASELHLSDGVCTLRAVPAGTNPSDRTPFAGPRIGVGERDTSRVSGGPNNGEAFNYQIWAQQLTGAFGYRSLGDCGLADGELLDPEFNFTTVTFICSAALHSAEAPSPTRSELQIDGANAYAPAAAEAINPNAAGFPVLNYSFSVDPATGNLVIHEADPLVKCAAATYPPTAALCANLLPTGVTDNRTVSQDHDGHIAWISDSFTSTDGHTHTLDLLWSNAQHFGGMVSDSTQLEYEFPGQSSYSLHALGDRVSLPTSPGTIFVRMHGANDGDPTTGQGAIVYDRPATAATFTGVNSLSNNFVLHQTGTVPTGGSTLFRFAYVQDYVAANVASMAQTATAAFLNPLTVAKTGSGSGTVTSSVAGISCGATCSHAYPYGTSVTLTATPATGSSFSGWSGACSGTGACTVTTNQASSVTASFSLIPETLSVATTGDGKGTVTSQPAGISCGASCSHPYSYGSTITLTAQAAKGSAFSGWSGACSGKTACTLSLTATRTVQATFLKNCLVPKLKGKTLKKAKRLLKARDCTTGKITHAASKRVRKGRVITQKPGPGRQLAHGAKIRLLVSKGHPHKTKHTTKRKH